MTGPRLLRRLSPLLLAGAAAATGGCVSTTDIDALHAQISDLQRQVLQVQTQGSSKQEVAKLQAALQQQTQSLLKSEADMQVELKSCRARSQASRPSSRTPTTASSSCRSRSPRRRRSCAARAATRRAGAGPIRRRPDTETLYQTAYGDYLRSNYDLAMLGFQQYLEAFPDTELCRQRRLLDRRVLLPAAASSPRRSQQFDLLQQRYPRSDKTASSWLKKGYALLELSQKQAGIAQLQQGDSRLPGQRRGQPRPPAPADPRR